MKKMIISLGTTFAALAPVIAVVSCGKTTQNKTQETQNQTVSNQNANPVNNNQNNAPTNQQVQHPFVEPIQNVHREANANVFSTAVERPHTIAELKKQNPYYASLNDNAKGEELFNEIHKIQMQHAANVGSYGHLWDTYRTAFVDNYDDKNGKLLDIYEEIPGQADKVEFTLVTDQDRGHHSREGDSYNREHLVPRSVFDTKSGHTYQNIPPQNDAHFVFPTDSFVNGDHGDIPFGNAANGKVISTNGTKMGGGVVEPINAFKGDVARATLYFAVTWRTEARFNPSNKPFAPLTANKAWPVVTQSFEKTYSDWSQLDPVSKWDVDRNEAIAKSEGGLRNPFDDMPDLIKMIWN